MNRQIGYGFRILSRVITGLLEVVLYGFAFGIPLGELALLIDWIGPIPVGDCIKWTLVFAAAEIVSWLTGRERLWAVVLQTLCYALFVWSMYWWYREFTLLHPSVYWGQHPM